MYRSTDCFVLIGLDSSLLPRIGRVEEILILDTATAVFIVTPCELHYYDSHYHSYSYSLRGNRTLVPLNSLLDILFFTLENLSTLQKSMCVLNML